MKKYILLTVLILTALFVIPASALSGSGTEVDPYLVSSSADIIKIHDDLDGYYKLTADIDMTGIEFEPIGNENEGAFTGTIDGNGHTISNLDINLPENKYVGLVGYLEGTVKQLTLEDVDACGYKYVGGIAGYSEDGSTIEGCEVSGNVSGINALNGTEYTIFLGGIIAYSKGVVDKCQNAASVSYDKSDIFAYCGGIVGTNKNGRITSCTNYAEVISYSLGNSARSGGVVGQNESGIVNNCINYGMTISDYCVGGIGGFSTYGEINNCVNFGKIEVRGYYSYAGGIIGRFGHSMVLSCVNYGTLSCNSSSSTYILKMGGICGSDYLLTGINRCINYGLVEYATTNSSFIGGIAGEGNVNQCINYNGNISGYYSGGIAASGDIINCVSYGSKLGGHTTNSYVGTYIHRLDLATSLNISLSDPLSGSYYSINNVYEIREISGTSYIPTNQLDFNLFRVQDSFDLDFENIWFIDPNTNSGFPQLRNMPRHIDLNECVLLLNVGEAAMLKAYIDGVSESVTWSSENEDIATVSSDGVVTALATGDIMISATNDEGMKANCLVHITRDVSAVSLNKTETEIKAGSSETLTYTLNPIDANEVVMWQSSNENIVTVDQTGVVSAKAIGKATITVTTVTTGKSASCEVTVVGAPITNVNIPTSVTVNKGATTKLSLTVEPTQYAGIVIWSSSDESVATVSEDGTVTGLKAGNTVITATSDTGKTDTCTVTVKVPSTEIILSKTELTIEKGLTEKLIATLTPEDTTDTITWSSSNSSYASVASDGTVTAKAVGSATITATTTSGKKAYCFVKIIAANVPVTSVTLNNTELIMTKADTTQLTAEVLPSTATNKTLTWQTSDESVATVSNTGVVSAVGEGVAIITVTANNGMYHECVIKVVSASGPSIILNDTKASATGVATVKASIVKNPGISAYQFKINYDADILTPVSVTPNSEFGGTFASNLSDSERTELNVVWYANEDVNINGELFTVEFTVSGNAEYNTETNVSVTYGATDICNVSGEYIALYTQEASVEIVEPTPGNVYEDDEVNVYDLTLLARYITGLEVFNLRQQAAADVNNDDSVDIKDVVILAQYLVGYNGVQLMSLRSNTAEIVLDASAVLSSGESVIPVSIRNNTGVAGFRYEIEYDSDKLEIISIKPNTELLGNNFNTNLGNEGENGLIVSWYNEENLVEDGLLFNIIVRAKTKDAKAAISIKEADNNMCDQQIKDVIGTYSFEFVSLYGDANMDGSLNSVDSVELSRHLAKWSGYDGIDAYSADLDGDGKVTSSDSVVLSRHLAKWSGYETIPLE